MAKATKKTTKSANKGKKSESATFTYMQGKALTCALLHVGYTTAQMAQITDKAIADLPESAKEQLAKGKEMTPEAKAKWLAEKGEQPASYGQCARYVWVLNLGGMTPEQCSDLIAKLDKKSGYTPKPKDEKPKEEPKAEEAKPEEPTLLEEPEADEAEEADTDKPE